MTVVFRRYANRKIFDAVRHRYVSCGEIADAAIKGDEVRVLGYRDGADRTEAALAWRLADLLRAGSRAKALALGRVIVARLEE